MANDNDEDVATEVDNVFNIPTNMSFSGLVVMKGSKEKLDEPTARNDVKPVILTTDTSKALAHAFFSQRLTSKVPNVTDIGLKPRQIKKVAVIGGGLMGSGIAAAFLQGNINVILKATNAESLHKGIKLIQANMRGLVEKGNMARAKADKALSLLKGVLDYIEFKDVDLVIETVIENITLKQAIFSEIEKVCPSHCILATNTSTFDPQVIGNKTSSQDRIIGVHFYSSALLM
uniref:3-hydroxyacyl-CoA dehydrogenase NAD binding domain-containing protein n=1 Tax=Cannabis sativa TaxID=3483 RepID=A0A803P2S0_CANSA